jgi:hypothetical protein
MKNMRLTKSVEEFAIFAAKAAIYGDHIGPVPEDWRKIPAWWKTQGRKLHVARQGGASAKQLEGPVGLLSAILVARCSGFSR